MFFFASRRRHTRLQGDWSSDVCSSDLVQQAHGLGAEAARHRPEAGEEEPIVVPALDERVNRVAVGLDRRDDDLTVQIGRASCRERVEITVVGRVYQTSVDST